MSNQFDRLVRWFEQVFDDIVQGVYNAVDWLDGK